MKTEDLDQNKLLEYNSSRHHYIPRFLLNGFTNSDGFLYIFDKQKNKILKGPKSPKSYFFEPDRNTIDAPEGGKTSMLEDFIYQKLDNDCSKTVQYFQNEELDKINLTTENTAHFQFFMINLFWRIPVTDFAAEDIMNNTEILSSDIDSDKLKNDPGFRKLQRSALFKDTIDEIVKSGKKGNRHVHIHHSESPILVIGDYPILFRKTPTKFSELDELDSYMAISSNRIYSSTNKTVKPLTLSNKINYNLAVIHQSERYVGAEDLRVLEASLKVYNGMRSEGLENFVVDHFFAGIEE